MEKSSATGSVEVDVPDLSLITYLDGDLVAGTSGTTTSINLTGITSPNPQIDFSDIYFLNTTHATTITSDAVNASGPVTTGVTNATTLDATTIISTTATIPNLSAISSPKNISISGTLTGTITTTGNTTTSSLISNNSLTGTTTTLSTNTTISNGIEAPSTNFETFRSFEAVSTDPLLHLPNMGARIVYSSASGPGNNIYFALTPSNPDGILWTAIPFGFYDFVVNYDLTNQENSNTDTYLYVHTTGFQPNAGFISRDAFSYTNDDYTHFIPSSAFDVLPPNAPRIATLRTRRPPILNPGTLFKVSLLNVDPANVTYTGTRTVDINHIF